MAAPAVQQSSTPFAPTTQVDSTESAPHGPDISPISRGGAPSQEVPMHTGISNGIDPYYHLQYQPLASVLWNGNQNPGTRLWSVKLSPKYNTPHVRHMSKRYNTWGGGFEFNIKICGSGFTQGAVIVFKIPPNVNIDDLTTTQAMCMFPYKILDAKTIELVSEYGSDQRRVMYHYMNGDDGTDDHGGTLAIAVFSPLTTSSTGSQQVYIQVLSRLAPDFVFSQPIPLPEEKDEPSVGDSDGEALAKALSLNSERNALATATIQKKITRIVIEPKTFVTPANVSIGGSRKVSGELIQKSEFEWPMLQAVQTEHLNTDSARIQPLAYTMLPKGTGTYSFAGKSFPGAREISEFDKSLDMPDVGTFKVTTAMKIGGDGTYRADDALLMAISNYTEAKREFPQKNSTESYVTFSCDDLGKKDKCLQPESLASLLKAGTYSKIMAPNEAAIFDLVDIDNAIPVHRLKLYYSGIITSKGVDDQIMLPANKYSVKFIQFTKATEPIPAPSNDQAMATHLYNLAFTAEKQMKQLESKWLQLQQSLPETSSPASDRE